MLQCFTLTLLSLQRLLCGLVMWHSPLFPCQQIIYKVELPTNRWPGSICDRFGCPKMLVTRKYRFSIISIFCESHNPTTEESSKCYYTGDGKVNISARLAVIVFRSLHNDQVGRKVDTPCQCAGSYQHLQKMEDASGYIVGGNSWPTVCLEWLPCSNPVETTLMPLKKRKTDCQQLFFHQQYLLCKWLT